MPHKTNELVVRPLSLPDKQTHFGAVVTGVDLNDLDDETFAALRNAVYEHSVIVIKGQQDLLPLKQFEFVHRFDPDATPRHGFGYNKTEKEIGNLGKQPYYIIPDSGGGVTLVGHGYQGDDHFGLSHVTMFGRTHADFQYHPLSPEQIAAGHVRMNSFHFDGIIHGSYPSRVTTFRCVRAPDGAPLTVHLDNELDEVQSAKSRTLTCAPGSTAFVSCSQVYDMLTDDERAVLDHSSWEPAPFPFAWSGNRCQRAAGLGLAPGGQTVPLDELPAWTPDQIHRYPLVWCNPVTGKRAVMVMPETVHRLFLRSGPGAPERVVEDLEEIRVFLNNIYDRILEPEYIITPTVAEGDVVVWNNWGVLHSGIGYHINHGIRSMHQCHIASSTPPVGPQEVTVA